MLLKWKQMPTLEKHGMKQNKCNFIRFTVNYFIYLGSLNIQNNEKYKRI